VHFIGVKDNIIKQYTSHKIKTPQTVSPHYKIIRAISHKIKTLQTVWPNYGIIRDILHKIKTLQTVLPMIMGSSGISHKIKSLQTVSPNYGIIRGISHKIKTLQTISPMQDHQENLILNQPYRLFHHITRSNRSISHKIETLQTVSPNNEIISGIRTKNSKNIKNNQAYGC